MSLNAAGLDVSGQGNPNWKGGQIAKICEVCASPYLAKRANLKSRFCSLQCVGISQKGRSMPSRTGKPRAYKMTTLICSECSVKFTVPQSHAHKYRCCSRVCQAKQHAVRMAGERNANWRGGLSRLPYPWNFRDISAAIIARDGNRCQNPQCARTDQRLTSHHINYQKQDCRGENLIALCSACNSKANFGRDRWQAFYCDIMRAKLLGGGWAVEEF